MLRIDLGGLRCVVLERAAGAAMENLHFKNDRELAKLRTSKFFADGEWDTWLEVVGNRKIPSPTKPGSLRRVHITTMLSRAFCIPDVVANQLWQ
jgi:hypothetical protein